MSLKRRNIIAIILLFLAALFWTYGQRALQEISNADPVNTTSVTMYGTSITHPTSDQSLPSNSYIPSLTTANTEPTNTRVGIESASSRSSKMIGAVLCILSVICFIVSFVMFPKSPILGPDIAVTVCALVSWIYLSWIRGETIEYFFGYFAIVEVLYLFISFLALWDLFGWFFARCDIKWCFVFRMICRISAPQISILLFTAWILICVLAIVLLWIASAAQPIPVLFLVCCAILSVASLWHYGADLQHFQNQLNNFQQGKPIVIKQGAFSQAETQLLDIQSQHEEAIQKAVISERFKVELIANVSHDLRTPLTSILGYSELLQEEMLSPNGQDQLHRLHQKVSYMHELVESLFELTKVSSGASESKLDRLDLIRLLEQTIGLFDDQLNTSQLTIRRIYTCEEAIVITDGARMHQVFANLIGNAMKYALSGTRIYLEVKECNDQYSIRLTNTSSYEMDFNTDEILERFARGDKARSTKGSGLGLAIAKTYTESVGGSFHIHVDGDQFNAIVELPKM